MYLYQIAFRHEAPKSECFLEHNIIPSIQLRSHTYYKSQSRHVDTFHISQFVLFYPRIDLFLYLCLHSNQDCLALTMKNKATLFKYTRTMSFARQCGRFEISLLHISVYILRREPFRLQNCKVSHPETWFVRSWRIQRR